MFIATPTISIVISNSQFTMHKANIYRLYDQIEHNAKQKFPFIIEKSERSQDIIKPNRKFREVKMIAIRTTKVDRSSVCRSIVRVDSTKEGRFSTELGGNKAAASESSNLSASTMPLDILTIIYGSS